MSLTTMRFNIIEQLVGKIYCESQMNLLLGGAIKLRILRAGKIYIV